MQTLERMEKLADLAATCPSALRVRVTVPKDLMQMSHFRLIKTLRKTSSAHLVF